MRPRQPFSEAGIDYRLSFFAAFHALFWLLPDPRGRFFFVLAASAGIGWAWRCRWAA